MAFFPLPLFLVLLSLRWICRTQCSVPPSTEGGVPSVIRIAAYDPKPPPSPPQVLLPEKMLARRMGEGPILIEDPPRIPRDTQREKERTRRRRPVRTRANSPKHIQRPSRPSRGSTGKSSSLGSSLFDPSILQNPLNAEPSVSSDSAKPSLANPPVGPPGSFGGVFPPGVFPPSPVIRPPSPLPEPPGVIGPPTPPELTSVGPPTPPPFSKTPSPPPGIKKSNVTGIKCMEFNGQESFEAVLTLPTGFEAVPVFEDRPSIDPTINPSCRMIPTKLVGMFHLIVNSYEACGVRKCRQSNGEVWNCLILRYPILNRLKLPEDELIEIRCRPHSRTASDDHVLQVATAKYADINKILTNKPPAVFEGVQEFQCEIGLFRRLPGTNDFTSRIQGDAELELGEPVQLWSIIRSGDGWRYSRLSEVVIQKYSEGDDLRSFPHLLVLVYSDGCRNPNLTVIAEDHPIRDQENALINKFTFRVFMFQDMEPGDSLSIYAKVTGCILEEDCRPKECADDGGLGYGRRRRRAVGKTEDFSFTSTLPPVGSTTPLNPPPPVGPPIASTHHYPLESHTRKSKSNVTNWSRNLSIRVRMPDAVKQREIVFKDCRLYLYISLGISLFFCLLAITVASISISRIRKEQAKRKTEANSKTAKVPSEKKARKKPLVGQISSGSENYTSSSESCSSAGPQFQQIPVPPTIRQRKKQVNAEILNLFGDHPYGAVSGQFPPMMNYYGYMVVPRAVPSSHQKKTIRGLKRKGNPKPLQHFNDVCYNYSGEGRRKEIARKERAKAPYQRHSTETTLSDTESQVSNHASIIRITSTGSETISSCSSRRPKPLPRNLNGDHIYNEIRQDFPPTMV